MRYAFAIILVLCAPAYGRSSFRATPLPYSCDQVRWAIHMFSLPHLRAMGKKLGVQLTPAQMREAQKCLDRSVS